MSRNLRAYNEYLVIAYKLLAEALALMVVASFFYLLIEILLPRFLSAHIQFFSVFIAIFFLVGCLLVVGKYLNLFTRPERKKTNSNFLVAAYSFGILLLLATFFSDWLVWYTWLIIVFAYLVVFFILQDEL